MFTFSLIYLRLLLTWASFTLSLSAAQLPVPPLEAKRDQLMEMRFETSLAALREKDDAKTIALLKIMAGNFTAGIRKIKPEYQLWYRSLTVEEKRMLLYQAKTKRWLQLMEEIQLDTCIQSRFKSNMALKQEYESIQFICDKVLEMDL